MDINVLLEKQLEEIGNFTDKKISKNFTFGLEVENPAASISSIQEGLTGNRLPLSPLAARAALASLRSISNSEKDDITSETPPQGVVFSDPSPAAKGKGLKKKNKISGKKMIQPSETRVTQIWISP